MNDKLRNSDRSKRARATVERLGIVGEYPFDHHFIESPMGAMHYIDEGSGDPVLAIHGNPSWSFLYRKFITELSESNRVIAPDHIGFGLSDKPQREQDYTLEKHIANIELLLTQLDLKNVTLIVQDWGGPIGLTAAARHPERIKAIVVLNSFGFYPPMDSMDPDNLKLPLPLRIMRTSGLGDVMVRRLGMFEGVVMPSAIADKRGWKQVKRAYKGVFENSNDRAGVMAFPRMIPTNRQHPSAKIMLSETGPFIENFRGPVQIHWGLKDPFFPNEVLAAWKKRIPQAEVFELPKAKHYIQEDSPDTIIPRVKEFLLRNRERTRAGRNLQYA
jgi:pimeloyl-ACP methyl ester carboxylesterase